MVPRSIEHAVQDVWTVYQATRAEVLPRSREQTFTRRRHELVARRIKTHGEEAVMAAVDGWRHDPWYRGEEGATRAYGGEIEAVLYVGSKGDRIERFAAMAVDPPRPPEEDPVAAIRAAREAREARERAASIETEET
jgi:hypothetical protein